MAYSEAQKRATAKYNKEKVKQKVVRFYPTEKELFDYISQFDNFGGYVKELISKDMESKLK